MPKTLALTAMQALFVQEYLIDLHPTKAAIRAGYSEEEAKRLGYENLSNSDVQIAITMVYDKGYKICPDCGILHRPSKKTVN